MWQSKPRVDNYAWLKVTDCKKLCKIEFKNPMKEGRGCRGWPDVD